MTAPRATVLHVVAESPDADALGGVAIHVAALAEHSPPGIRTFAVHPTPSELRVEEWPERSLAALIPTTPAGPGRIETPLLAAILGTGAAVVHVHSPMLGGEDLAHAIRRSGASALVTLHDGALACENHTLLEGGERHCDIPEDLARCHACLAKTHGHPPGAVLFWRRGMAELVAATHGFVAPSESALWLAAKVHPEIRDRARLIPWGVPESHVRATVLATEPGPVRVAVVGVWARVKGVDRLPSLLEACRGLDVEFHLFGATEGASLGHLGATGARVVRHGAYPRRELPARLASAGCHLALLPSVAAESFSLTLSEVTGFGIPAVASDLGALGERVRKERLGWVFDPWAPESLSHVLGRLAAHRPEIDDAARDLRARAPRTEAQMAASHAELWFELSKRDNPCPDPEDVHRALSEYARAAKRAAERRPSVIAAFARTIRKSDAYRDLPLRRLLPERTRKRAEDLLRKLLSRRGRA